MVEAAKYPHEHIVRSCTIPAPASAIFSLLADPGRHHDTEPGDWVREAIDAAPITGTGQIFSMHMFHEAAGGDYRIDNTVTTFEPDRSIAWDPGQADDAGTVVPGGWRWRYDLEEGDSGTEVTLTYDWSRTSQETREAFGGFPVVPPEYLEASLETVEQAVIEGA